MKSQRTYSMIAILLGCLLPFFSFSQDNVTADSTGLPGDHFSLEGALDLFKNAESPEAFEKALNTESNFVNNLDLNEDGDIDYIRVIDHVEGDAHAIVLQVPVNEDEAQDVAVIEIEKQGPEYAILQIIGDEDLYGPEHIVEPYEEEVKSGGKGGPSADMELTRLVVNVYLWPSVRYIYRPNYVVWVSPFRWRNYPRWWSPWRPHPWRYVHTRRVHYRPYCHRVTTHRVVTAHKVYQPRRTSSKVVRTKTTRVGVQKKNGNVRVGKSTTTTTRVKDNKGNTRTKQTTTTRAAGKNKNGTRAAGKKKTTTTRVKGKNGNKGAQRTTTTKKRKRKKQG